MTLPDDVEEAMADIALVFHWTPGEMDGFTVEELARWREKARARSEHSQGPGQG